MSARATRRARSSDRRRPRSGSDRPLRGLIGSASRPRSIAVITSSPRRRTTSGVMPRIWARSRRARGWRLASSTTVGSRRIAPTGRSSGGRGELAPGRDRPRDRALARIEPAHPRQPAPDLVRVALVGGLGDRDALLARPPEPAALGQPALNVVGQRQQVFDVAARIPDLLIGQWSCVPAREAGRLRQPDPEHVVEQAVVAGLRREARRSPPRPACRRRW